MTTSALAEPIHDDHHGRRVADGSMVIVDIRGPVRRSTVGALANHVRDLVVRRNTTVAVDLCGVVNPDHWLVSALAKAHVAARARGAHLWVIVGDDATSTLLDTTGISRIAARLSHLRLDRVASRNASLEPCRAGSVLSAP